MFISTIIPKHIPTLSIKYVTRLLRLYVTCVITYNNKSHKSFNRTIEPILTISHIK